MTYAEIPDTVTTSEQGVAYCAFALTRANRDPDNLELAAILSDGGDHSFVNAVEIAYDFIDPRTLEPKVWGAMQYSPGMLHIRGTLSYRPQPTTWGMSSLRTNILPYSGFALDGATSAGDSLEQLFYGYCKDQITKTLTFLQPPIPPEYPTLELDQFDEFPHPQIAELRFDLVPNPKTATIGFYFALPFNANTWQHQDDIIVAMQDITLLTTVYKFRKVVSASGG